MSYHFTLATFHKFAFYFCIVLYRLRKTNTGIYVTETFIIQKVSKIYIACFFNPRNFNVLLFLIFTIFNIFQLIAIIFYILPHYWHILATYHSYQSIWLNRNPSRNASPYFFLLYMFAHGIFTQCTMYRTMFHSKYYLKFLNSLSFVLNKYGTRITRSKDSKVCMS